MKKILENMDAAAVGNKPFKGDQNFNDMKKILEGFDSVTTSKPKQQLDEAATLSMTADNAQQVGELMALMQRAGMDPKPVAADMPMKTGNPMKFQPGAAYDDPNIPGRDDVPGDQDLNQGFGTLGKIAGGALGGAAGSVGGAALGTKYGTMAGNAIAPGVGGPIGGAIGGAIGAAAPAVAGAELLGSDAHDDPNIPGRDDVPGDVDLKAGQGGALAGSVAGGAAGHVLGKGIGDALGAIGQGAGTAMGGETGGEIGKMIGQSIPAVAGSIAGSKVGDKLTGEDYANEPDEEYAPYSDMTKGGTDLNKSKKSYPKVAGGDNPMALKNKIKEELNAFYKQYKI